MRGEAILHFSDDKFPILFRIDTADPSGPYVELEHETRDYREGDRKVGYRAGRYGPMAGSDGGSSAPAPIAG